MYPALFVLRVTSALLLSSSRVASANLSICSNQLQNFGAYSMNNDEDAAVEAWNIEANRNSLVNRLRRFHPSIQEVCKSTNEILPLWKCADRQPLTKLHHGKLVLVGDSSHPMLPHIGQGAASAMEDAATLGILMSEPLFQAEYSSPYEEICERLELFESLRKDRVAALQILSSVPVGEGSYERVERALREYFPTGKFPSMYCFLFATPTPSVIPLLHHDY